MTNIISPSAQIKDSVIKDSDIFHNTISNGLTK